VTTPAQAPQTHKVTDLKGVIQFFDKDRVKSLSKALVPATAIKWPKAKEADIDAMTQDAMWRVLEAGKNIDPYNPSQRANICDQVTKSMAVEYNHRCKKRNLKRKDRVQRKGLETNLNLFMTQVTLVAFVLYGDVRKSPGVLMA
jgi:hypothetical protein